MTAYILRRILFMIPTIVGMMAVTFVVVQFAPGGPIDHVLAKLSATHTGTGGSVTGSDQTDINSKTGAQ